MAKKLTIWVCIALGIAMVLGLVWIVLLNTDVKTNTTVKVFVEHEPTDVETITVLNTYGQYTIRSEDDGYVFDDIPVNIVDVEGFYELMNHACAFGSLRTVTDVPNTLEKYGLDKPKAILSVTFTDGSTFGMSIGNKEPVSGNYYGRVEGDKAVYLFAEEDMLYFLCRKETYISTLVTPELAVSSPLSAIKDITFSGSAFEHPITVEAVSDTNPEAKLLAKSFGPATHIVRLKGVYELDQTYGIEMLSSVLGIRAVDVIGYNLSDSDLTKLGFDNPAFRVAFALKNGTDYIADYELSLVPAKEYYMASMKGSGVVYIIEPPAFVTLDYTKLCLRWFLSPLLSDLQNLSVEFDGKTYTYVYTKDEDKNVSVTVNGEAMDPELFYKFYRLVTSASSDGLYLENPTAEGDPLMTVTYVYNDGVKPPDVMKLYKGSARRTNVEVNGVIEFDMAESYLDAMKTACAHTVSGEEIEENW